MSGPVIETAPWSDRFWFLTILLLFVAQTSLIFWLTSSSHVRPLEPPQRGPIRILSGATYEALRAMGGLTDPTLFALVHPQGFSGAAWLKPAEFPYQLTNHIDPPRGLAADPLNLALEFARLTRTNGIPASLFASKPPLVSPPMQFSTVTAVVQPRLRIEGDLASRPLLTSAKLPEADPGKILTNCVISVMVAANGDILSASFQTSSGSLEADREALKFAYGARFAPAAGRDHDDAASPFGADFGQLVFQWLLVPEAKTAAPTKP